MKNIMSASLLQFKHCIEHITDRIETEEKPITNNELLKMCRPVGDILEGTINPHFCHEIAEAAINQIIQQKYAQELLQEKPNDVQLIAAIRKIAAKIPTQTWRSKEQNALQQFSTPPAIAYLLLRLTGLRKTEVVLEPSAGTGSLAIWADGAGCKTHVNEIDTRRCELLRYLGFTPTVHNSEFINDLLAPEIKPDCVLMNPPFSANGERIKSKSSRFGFRHVASALERLKPGGKFGIILGEAANLERKTANDFLSELCNKFEFNAVIKIDGREYYKNGTTTDVNLIVGRKRIKTELTDWTTPRENILSFTAQTVEDAFLRISSENSRLTTGS